MALALASLAALVLATGWLAVRPGVLPRLVWVGVTALWWIFNKPLEGLVVLRVTDDNGVTFADFVPLLCLAAVALARRRRTHVS